MKKKAIIEDEATLPLQGSWSARSSEEARNKAREHRDRAKSR